MTVQAMRKRAHRTIAGRKIPSDCLTPIAVHDGLVRKIEQTFNLSDIEKARIRSAIDDAVTSERQRRLALLADSLELDLETPSDARHLSLLLATEKPLHGFTTSKNGHRVGRPRGSRAYGKNLWVARGLVMGLENATSLEACEALSKHGHAYGIRPEPGMRKWRSVPPRTLDAAANRFLAMLDSPAPADAVIAAINRILAEKTKPQGGKANHE